MTVQHEGTLLLRNNSKVSNDLFVSGIGSGTNAANRGSLIGSFGTAGSTAEYAGTISVLGDTRFTTTSSASGDETSKLLISGNVDLGASQLTLKSRKGTVGVTNLGLLIEITGTMSGTGGVVVDGEGSYGRVKISGANSYSGGTTITTGTLIVGNNAALGTGFLAVNTSGLDLNGFSVTAGALSGSASGVIQSNVAGAARLITNSTVSGTYAGTIGNGSGTVGYTKQGSGSQFLTGTSSYTGSTLVEGGSLYVNGQLGNTTTTVQSAGTLSGAGTILGDVTVNGGGTVSAGQDALALGTLTVGSLTLMSGASAALKIDGELAGMFDKIVATGSTSFGGTLLIDMNYAGGNFQSDLTGSFWQLFEAASFSGDWDSIVMTGVYGTRTFVQVQGNPGRWESPYLGDGKEFAFFTSGTNVGKLIAVPEPSTLAIGCAGAICLLGRRWSRRRRLAQSVS